MRLTTIPLSAGVENRICHLVRGHLQRSRERLAWVHAKWADRFLQPD